MTKVGIYGWGVVAPRSPDITAFARNLREGGSWLAPFRGFGPDNFLVGKPDFQFEAYRGWLDARFPPNRFHQLKSKMDSTTLYAVGSFIQALDQNPGIEAVLTELGSAAHVYVGTGLSALPTLYDASVGAHRAQRVWNRFWAQPERNSALTAHLAGTQSWEDAPMDPSGFPVGFDREDAQDTWEAFWAARSSELERFLVELAEIEGESVEGSVESGKLKAIRDRERRKQKLMEEWGAPPPPWGEVSTNVLWNIPNTPAAQISMLGRIHGMNFAPVAACATFGVCVKLGMDAIRRGEAKAVVVGAADPAPHPLSVGAFYGARVLSADGGVSKPLTGLRGTHVSGGAAIWILGERSFMEDRGFHPLGMEPVEVGVSSDADHIITPSREGPSQAILGALSAAGFTPGDLASWDLHATATPGDYLEVETLRGVLPEGVWVTARKGTFGHGMSAGGGWELTAQYLGAAEGVLLPTPLRASELNPQIAGVHQAFVLGEAVPLPPGRPVGKLSMGVGGINACVLSQPLDG